MKPENAIQAELGYVGEPAKGLSLQLSGFGTNLYDVIQIVSKVGPNNESQNQNAGRARFYGYEFGVHFIALENLPAINKFVSSINCSYINRRNLTTPSLLFTDVPDHKTVLSFDYYPLQWASVMWTTEWNSQRYSSSDGKRVAAAFVVENIRAQASYLRMTLNVGINNLFDANYCLLEGYPEPGRNYHANLSYDLKR